MPSAKKAGVGIAVVGGLAALAYVLLGKRSETAPARPGPSPGPAPAPPPGPIPGGYTYPPGFNPAELRSFLVTQAFAKGIPSWIGVATAVAEDGLRWPPTPPKLERGGYGATFYPMGIKSGTIATALNRGVEWAGNPAMFDRIGYDVPAQIDAAIRLLAVYWRQAQGARSEDLAIHAVRVAWQAGNMTSVLQTQSLPEWYTARRAGDGASYARHWAEAVFAAGGPELLAVA